MKIPPAKLILAAAYGTLGVAFAAAGFYVGETDDSPGAAFLGLVLMTGLGTLAVRSLRRNSSPAA